MFQEARKYLQYIVLVEILKDFDARREQIGLAGGNHLQAHGLSLHLRHHGIEQGGLFDGGGGDLLFQLIAESHDLVDFG